MIPDLAIAVQRFGLGDPLQQPVPVARAWSNEVWRVTTASGSYALKLFPASLADRRRRELEAGIGFEQQVLAAGQVPIPQPVTAEGALLIEVATPAGPRLTRCHHWVHGSAAERPLPDQLVDAAGHHLGLLHALDLPGGDTGRLAPLDVDRWHRTAGAAAGAGLGWAPELAGLTPLVLELATDLERLRGERRPMRLSHRDYDPKNTIVDTAGRLVVTDWDYAGPVLPEVELVVAATSFAADDAQPAVFVDAYRRAGGAAPIATPLALTAELADLDWLLRNVEACLPGGRPITAHPTTHDAYATAAELITGLPPEVAELRAHAARIAHSLEPDS